MKYYSLLVFLLSSLISYSQEFAVEKIQLTETIDNTYVSEIPRLRDKSNDNSHVVERINSQILDYFTISSFVQSKLEEFRWREVAFSYEIKGSILYISIAGEYFGAYSNYVTDELFFDLRSGSSLEKNMIPFHALFTVPGYLDFLNKYWYKGVKKEFLEAIKCAGVEPHCSYYDINYNFNNNKISISLIMDECYSHVIQACSPGYEISIEPDSMKPYLNDVGKYILLESKYRNMTAIEKFQVHERLKDEVPNNVFFFGKIDAKYPFSMAFNIDKYKQISGLYYYDSKLQKINLIGQSNDNTIYLTEMLNNKQNGFFEFDINKDTDLIVGKWMNFEKTKGFNIKFTKILTNKNN